MNKGKPPKYPELEKAIFSWVQELRSKLKPVTRAMVQIKAKMLSQKSPILPIILVLQKVNLAISGSMAL